MKWRETREREERDTHQIRRQWRENSWAPTAILVPGDDGPSRRARWASRRHTVDRHYFPDRGEGERAIDYRSRATYVRTLALFPPPFSSASALSRCENGATATLSPPVPDLCVPFQFQPRPRAFLGLALSSRLRFLRNKWEDKDHDLSRARTQITLLEWDTWMIHTSFPLIPEHNLVFSVEVVGEILLLHNALQFMFYAGIFKMSKIKISHFSVNLYYIYNTNIEKFGSMRKFN